MGESKNPNEGGGNCEQSSSSTLEAGSQLLRMKEDSDILLRTGATVNVARFRWLANRSSLLDKFGHPRVETYPAKARFEFGGGRMGAARVAGGITVGFARS